MAIAPPEEMQECFESLRLMDLNHRNTGGLEDFKKMDRAFRGRRDDIWQELLEEKTIKKAYYCAFPSFVDYCHLVVRAKERKEFSAVLMFLTLSRKKARKKVDIPQEMELLKEAMGDALRIGDVFTRYGSRHFILLLVGTEIKFCAGIFRRIETMYDGRGGKGDLWYYADMTQKLERM